MKDVLKPDLKGRPILARPNTMFELTCRKYTETESSLFTNNKS